MTTLESSIYFVERAAAFPLPPSFDYSAYIEIERELWALFPETDGKRVNFVQIGLMGVIYCEAPDDGSELGMDETLIALPCPDNTIRPVRMKAVRHISLSEYRMAQHTNIKCMKPMVCTRDAWRAIGEQILGEEVRNDMQEAMAELRGAA